MSKQDEIKKAKELAVLKTYLEFRGIQDAEICAGESPDFAVKFGETNLLRFELVELTDPNERQVLGTDRAFRAKLDEIHIAELDSENAQKFVEVFSDARFEVAPSKGLDLVQKAYREFLTRFKADSDRFRNFVGDPLSDSPKTTYRSVFTISRMDGLTTKPHAALSGSGYWVNENYDGFREKFSKPYATCSDVTILAFWNPQFRPGDRDGVRSRLEAIVHGVANKSEIRVVAFDMVNRLVFIEHPDSV